MVPDFALLSAKGTRVRVSDDRGKRNIVLIVCGAGRPESVRSLVRQVSELYPEFAAEGAEVFAVVRGAGPEAGDLEHSCAPPFPALVDNDGHAHDLFSTRPSGRASLPYVFIVDRYGERRHVLRGAESQASWPARDIRSLHQPGVPGVRRLGMAHVGSVGATRQSRVTLVIGIIAGMLHAESGEEI